MKYLRQPTAFFCLIWAFTILTPLIYFPGPTVLTGHPWKVELSLSFILLIWALNSFKKDKPINCAFQKEDLRQIVIPFLFFVIWSGLSVFWASSLQSVFHHTFLWAAYFVFFIFISSTVVSQKLLRLNLIGVSLIVGAISVQCIIEYVFSPEIGQTYGFRFARYAEIQATLLPLFLSFALRLKGKNLVKAIFLNLIVWFAIILSMSRGALASAVLGVAFFIFLRVITKSIYDEKKRLFFLPVIGILLLTSLTYLPYIFSNIGKSTTLSRITVSNPDDPDNSLGNNVRFLFLGVTKEMFTDNIILGVGADNYGSEFNKYRKVYSSDERNKSNANQQEAYIPERAHNEYLQILSELGIIGGFIFIIFIFGIISISIKEIRDKSNNRNNILSHAALAGIFAFLISSLFSSFSFRLMQNGIVFFFLLVLMLRNRFSNQESSEEIKYFSFINQAKNKNFQIIAVISCMLLFTLSFLKATSQYLTFWAESEPNPIIATNLFKKAMLLDPSGASVNYSYGLKCLINQDFVSANKQFREAVDKGVNSSPVYSLLASAQILSNDTQSAEETLREAVYNYPYSVFIRVRYSLILETNGKLTEADNQFRIAQELNIKQANSWRYFIKEGAASANIKALSDNSNMVTLENLQPIQAVEIFLLEREISHPEEIIRIRH